MERNYKIGVLCGLGAYFLWGIFPIYWRFLHHVDAMEILASRFIWSMVFVGLLIVVMGKWQTFLNETKAIFANIKTAACMVLASIAITFNWGIFIWAVEVGRIVETSMGYYINPLMSVLMGVIFLRERLTKLQVIAVLCAAAGIGVIVVKNGSLPWVSVSLAMTFAFYGLLKKLIVAQALTTIMIETLLMSPFALYYLHTLSAKGGNIYQLADVPTLCLLAGAGVVTAVPLLLFTKCARLLPLKTTGFLQYVSPTLTLIVGVFMYGEAFTFTHALAFGCIWIGLLFFTWSQIRTK